jgi:hypothetical protein
VLVTASNIAAVKTLARSQVGLLLSVASNAKINLPRGIVVARARARKSSSAGLDGPGLDLRGGLNDTYILLYDLRKPRLVSSECGLGGGFLGITPLGEGLPGNNKNGGRL